jgi:hypothetical protein
MVYSAQITARLITINSQWPATDALAGTLPDDSTAVALWRAPQETRELLMVSADRDIGGPVGRDEIPAGIDLLIAGADAPDCPGFVERARAGNLKLLKRVERMARAPSGDRHR